MMRMIGQFDVDAVIVDLDGTMVDTLDDFVLALNRMLADLPPPYQNQQVDRAMVARLVGKGSEHLVKSVLALADRAQTAITTVAILEHSTGSAVNLDANQLDRLFGQAWPSYLFHYQAVNGQHASVYPGVEAALAYLKTQGLRLACLTNKPTAFARALLKIKGLADFFEFIFGGDAFERKKPDPLPLLKTCAALGTAPGRTLMIGDSSNDARAARAAGCPVLLVTYGYNHGLPVRAVDADAFTDSLQSLIPD
jgi:phosphoglycolate phosphatase